MASYWDARVEAGERFRHAPDEPEPVALRSRTVEQISRRLKLILIPLKEHKHHKQCINMYIYKALKLEFKRDDHGLVLQRPW